MTDKPKRDLPPEVAVLRPQLVKMMEGVCLVTFRVSRCRAKTRPSIATDSPFYNPKKPHRTLEDVLASIEQSARFHLSSQTIPIHWTDKEQRYVLHLHKFTKFDTEMMDYQKQYFVARDEMVGTDTASAAYRSFSFTLDYSFVDVSTWIEIDAKLCALTEQRAALYEDIRLHPSKTAEARVFEEMRKARLEIESRRLHDATSLQDNILREVKTHFTALAYEVSTDILASMNGTGFEGRHLSAMKKLLGVLTDVPFLADQDAKAMKESVIELFREYSTDMPTAEVRKVLTDIAVVTRSTLLKLDEAPRSAREMGVPDTPDEAMIRRSRIAIDAPLFDTEPQVRKSRSA